MSDAPRSAVAPQAGRLFVVIVAMATAHATAAGQGTQVARNRFKPEISFQAEPVADSAAKVGRFLLRNPGGYLAVPGTAVEVVPLASARNWTGHWVLQRTSDGYARFVNERTGSTLHYETGTAQVGAIQPGWWSAMWTVSAGVLFPPTAAPIATRQLMVNRWKPEMTFAVEAISLTRVRLRTAAGYLSSVNGRIGLTPAAVPTAAAASSEWLVMPVAPATVDCARPDCFFRLASPVGTGALHNQTGALLVGSYALDWYSAMWSRAPGTAMPTTAVPVIPVAAAPVTSDRQTMINRWKTDVRFEIEPISPGRVRLRTLAGYLSYVNGRVGITQNGVANTPTSSSEWVLGPVPPATADCTRPDCFFRMLSPVGSVGTALNNESGALALSPVRDDWHSAMWMRTQSSGTPNTIVPVIPMGTQPTPPPPPPPATPTSPKSVANRFRPVVVLQTVKPNGPADTAYVHLRNAAGAFLVIDNRQLQMVGAGYGSYLGMWRLEAVPGQPYVRIVNRQTGDYLHTERGVLGIGQVTAGTMNMDWWSGMWTVAR